MQYLSNAAGSLGILYITKSLSHCKPPFQLTQIYRHPTLVPKCRLVGDSRLALSNDDVGQLHSRMSEMGSFTSFQARVSNFRSLAP
jgi:hypothetical protein